MNLRTSLAVVLSLVPGAGHVFLKHYAKALVLLAVSAGIVLGWLFSKALIVKLLMVMIYAVTAMGAILEACQISKPGNPVLYTNQRWYVVILLLVTGFSALPLLWQSDQFSKTAKIAWTVAVPVLAVLFFTGLAVFWNDIENFLENLIRHHVR